MSFEALERRRFDEVIHALEGWVPVYVDGALVGYKTRPLSEAMAQRLVALSEDMVQRLIADHESVKPVENPEPATDPESASCVTPQPVDSTGKAT